MTSIARALQTPTDLARNGTRSTPAAFADCRVSGPHVRDDKPMVATSRKG